MSERRSANNGGPLGTMDWRVLGREEEEEEEESA
jgi:hypothetical protein